MNIHPILRAAGFLLLAGSLLQAANTGMIADPDDNIDIQASCESGGCRKVVTHRCLCIACDAGVTGSTCPCVQDDDGTVQQTIHPGQCVRVTVKVATDYERLGRGFRISTEASGEIQFCLYNSTPRTRVVSGPTCEV